jgi:hypothetical protein
MKLHTLTSHGADQAIIRALTQEVSYFHRIPAVVLTVNQWQFVFTVKDNNVQQ